MENDIIDSLIFVGFNTPSPVMKRRRSVDKQANAMTESLLHSSPHKTDEDVAIYDAMEGPRSRTRSSHKSSVSVIGGFSGWSSSSSSGGSNRRSSTSSSTSDSSLNPRAREYTPQRFGHSEQELWSGISNLSGTMVRRLSGGSSGGLIPPPSTTIRPSIALPVIPDPHMLFPRPASPSNNLYCPLPENSPSPSSLAPPQPPFLANPTPETTAHRPTTSSAAKSKSPVALNLPSEPAKTKPFLDETIIDVSTDLPSASISIQSPLCCDWVPIDDGIDCTLPPGSTRNETRFSVLLSAGSNPDGTTDSTLPSAGSTHNVTLSTLTSGSAQNDCSMMSGSSDQSRTFSREELDDYLKMVLHEVRPRKRLPVFENITKSESNE